MTTNIFLFRSNQKQGPYRLEDIEGFLQQNQIPITLMARFDGSGYWMPVYCIPEVREDPAFASMIKAATSGDAEIELAIVESTAKEVGQLIERLAQTVADENKELQQVVHRRTQILWRQVYTYKAQFPDTPEAGALEAWFYRLQALTRFNAAGYLRRQSQAATNVVWGMVTGLLASRQERTNAGEALALLDQAISAYDNPEDRLKKAYIYHLLGERNDTLRELDRIMVAWPPQENVEEYIAARQLRDEIEAA